MRNRRYLPLLLTCLLWLTASLASCANSNGQKPADGAESDVEQASQPAFDPLAALQDAAPWMPADTFAVVTAEGYQGTRWLEQFMPDREGVQPGQAGTPEALQQDLQALYRDRIGVDITSVQGAVVGVGRSWQTMVLFGEVVATDEIDRTDVQGHEALKIPVDFPREVRQFLGTEVWALQLQDPRPGLIVFRTRQALLRAVQAKTSPEDQGTETLAADGLDAFTDLYDSVSTDKMAAAVLLEELGMLQQMSGRLPVPLPDRVILGLGDTIGLNAVAPQETLDEIRGWIDRQRKQVEAIVDNLNANLDSRSTGQAASMLTAYHMGKAYLRVLEPTDTDGRLTYTFQVPGNQMMVASIGVLSAIAIPAFTKYLKRSKASEADQIMRKLVHGAKVYFIREQKGCKGMDARECRHPWHDATDAGLPVEFDRYVFPGGTDVKLVTTERTPRGGAKYLPEPTLLDAPEGVSLDSVMQQLNLGVQDPMYFKYIYETGPGTGNDATATVTAVHDFDPSSPAKHTVRQELTVQQGDVNITPAFTTNEFE